MKNLYKIRFLIAVVVMTTAIVCSSGIFYPFKLFDIQLTPVFQRVLVNLSVVSGVCFFSLLALTLIFGRLYCSIICPMGIFQEIICLLSKKKYKKAVNYPLKYLIAAITFGALIGGTSLLIRYLDPYTFFVSALTLSIIGLIATGLIAILAFFKGRLFCTDVCPVGAVLGIVSKFSLFKLHIDKEKCVSCGSCERKCPAGSINSKNCEIENETCIKCFRCLTLCPKDALKYGIKANKQKFDINRRKFINFAGAVVVFGVAIKAGLEITKKAAENIKYFILPPGAQNGNRMFNKCLNCNLCINACPNKIIKKADKEFAAVHIEYGNNGFCKFDCHNCGDICPSGAIKRISKEEKQKTRIAMAVINREKCIKCGICALKCPKNAIEKDETGIIAVGLNCIGCAACKAACPTCAIDVVPVKEQKVI